MDLSAVEGTDIAENFAEAVEKLGTVSDEYYKSVQKVNMLYAQILAEKSEEDLTELKAELDKELKVIVSVYKMIEDDFMGLDPWQTIAFRDQLAAGNYAGLQDTLDALKANDGAAALDALMGVDTTYLTCFSKEVYEYVGITGINESKQWAVGKTLPMLNTYDAYQAIQAKVDAGAKDFTDEIAMIEKLMEEEMKILKDVLTSGTEQLNIAAEKLEKSEITNVITMEEEILEK